MRKVPQTRLRACGCFANPSARAGVRPKSTNTQRPAAIVRPAKPYVEWASSLPGIPMAPEARGDEAVYLIPPFGSPEEAEDIIKQVFPALFERELHAWHTDEADWPQDRDYAIFRKWFTVELHSMVEDLCGHEITDEE